jgi:hypothetical protein
MKNLLLLLSMSSSLYLSAQDNPTEGAKHIVEEGKRLYRSEMASWYGTDLFLEKYKEQGKVGGYISYMEGDLAKCVFYSKEASPKVIGTVIFDSTYNLKAAITDLKERAFLTAERDLYTIRVRAADLIGRDSLFKSYQNTSLNLVPLMNGSEKKVYVLTGPKENGVVIFGNDYLITFDQDNKISSARQLHRSLIPIYYGGKGEEGKEVEGAMHTHLPETGDYITATDICTLMLYARFAKWKQHNVVSKNYLNIWNCLKNELAVIPMETIKKINEDQEKRKKAKD